MRTYANILKHSSTSPGRRNRQPDVQDGERLHARRQHSARVYPEPRVLGPAAQAEAGNNNNDNNNNSNKHAYAGKTE
jgi:hypothetical protein